MKIEVLGEDGAVAALEAVLEWASAEPDSQFEGKATGVVYQRGRIVASRVLSDNTVGVSTYNTVEEARDKAEDMEMAFREWAKMAARGRRLGGKR